MRLHKTKSQNGFISIIALGIFAVLMIYGIIISKSTINTIESVKNTNKYYAARDTADSVMEYLQYELNSREAGFNLSGGCLEDGTPKTNTVDANIMDSETCRQFYENLHLTDKNVKITAEIKGRSSAEAGEYFTDCPGMEATQCYVVPFPGTGDAGEKCSLYTPHFGQGTKTNRIDDNGQLVTNTTTLHSVPEVDYSCNWSKLSFGSSITDRVAIPLYYDDGMGSIISPFNSDTPINKRATEFVLRLRTPCEPFTGTQIPNDKTICADTGRFDLDDDPKDDIVVQWQITGTCEENEKDVACGMIQNTTEGDRYSAIKESIINTQVFHRALRTTSYSLDTSDYSQINDLPIIDRIKLYKTPTLALFLSEKLIASYPSSNVPYLEYQLLTDQPVANPKVKIEVIVNVDGNVFVKTLYKEEQKELIDFAVQN